MRREQQGTSCATQQRCGEDAAIVVLEAPSWAQLLWLWAPWSWWKLEVVGFMRFRPAIYLLSKNKQQPLAKTCVPAFKWSTHNGPWYNIVLHAAEHQQLFKKYLELSSMTSPALEHVAALSSRMRHQHMIIALLAEMSRIHCSSSEAIRVQWGLITSLGPSCQWSQIFTAKGLLNQLGCRKTCQKTTMVNQPFYFPWPNLPWVSQMLAPSHSWSTTPKKCWLTTPWVIPLSCAEDGKVGTIHSPHFYPWWV